ncbi:MAG: glucose-6-phosphate dehydrogenase assembly protein OpcA [Spirochaetales bacterium]|nr:glucose-6-phosphate dehydrogenase assembly protein OpcA [Spirochaetales bacterium]
MSASFDPAAIERRIDESLAVTGRPPEGAAPTTAALRRSSLLTLVVVHPSERQAAVAARLDYLFGRRPLRIIRIETGHSSPTTVDVSTRCLPHPSGDEVCFQEIVFYNGPDGRGLEAGVWSPLVIRDLPAVLLWPGEAAGLEGFLERSDFEFDKFVIDLETEIGRSAPRDAPRLVFGTLARLARRFGPKAGPAPPVISDLAWRALTPLRARIARLFDPEPARPLLARLERVAFSGLPALSAALLVLWLASRLGWSRWRSSKEGLVYKGPDGRAIDVKLPQGEARFSIEFFAAGEKPIGFGRGEAWNVACGEDCLLAEIDHLTPDPAFNEMLAAAARFAGEAAAD